ncbi:MAG: IS1182 family transposase [bacterium]|nr:IS1182 family transposase [bacterium]
MVLQRLEGLSDREAVERYSFDTRWRFAAGVGGYGGGKWGQFSHTVLVDMRARLAASEAPRRIFDVTLEAASQAGCVGAKRVLDSTPLYDAVATMDTITLIRSAIRSLLRVAEEELEGELRGALASGDDYATSAKPQIDWDDTGAREELIDSRARDAYACLLVLEGRVLSAEVKEAAELLATVVGQDLEETEDGTYRIARRVAKDRVISTVDTEARHGHKLIEDLVDNEVASSGAADASAGSEPEPSCADEQESERPKVYGDAAYGTGEFLNHLEKAGIDSGCKTQPPHNRNGLFPKSHFQVDLDTDTVTCPAEIIVPIRRTAADGGGIACFADACTDCPLRLECTTASRGRSIRVGPHEKLLAEARHRQKDPDWAADYRATRPKVERKIGHLMRRRHGGRRARVRGLAKVDADFNLLAAAHNLARLAVLGIQWTTLGWVAGTA